MVNLWQSGRDGMQGAFLQPIAGLWAKKATQQTARDRLITEHQELFRGSLDQHPALGRVGRVKGTRELVAHLNYILIYRVVAKVPEVLRIKHAAQKWP